MERLRRFIAQNGEVSLKATMINRTRMKHMAMVGIPVSLLHILFFMLSVKPQTQDEALWRMGIMAAHTALIVILGAIALFIHRMEKKENASLRSMLIIQYLFVLFIMIIGAGIVAIDQLVTPSITPFLVVCAIIAMVFLLSPFAAIPMYLTAYLLFFVFIGFTQQDASILASNRVNGITAVGIGIGLSFILWRYHSNDFFQLKFIEEQNLALEQQKAEVEAINTKLAYMAAYDTLTGLFNRREFEVLVNRTLLEMKRHGNEASMMVVDIDHFKCINDQYGHPVGDETLKQFSAILIKEVREIDIVARWGGEEFIIMLHNTPAKEGLLVAERIRKAIESTVFAIDGQSIKTTASFGVARLSASQADPLNTAYTQADRALYRAKNQGRNQCVLMGGGEAQG